MTFPRIGWKRLAVAVVLLAACALAAVPALRAAGGWLVVGDPPQQARAVVVLGGHLPFRAMEGAATYRQGWSREVWVTRGEATLEQSALSDLGIDRPGEEEYSRRVLIAQGVPESAIRVLPERNTNTADELRNVSRHLKSAGGGRVIVVTSKFHTRRVKIIWRVVAGGQPDAIVRYTPDDQFDPDRWWRNTKDAKSFVGEWFGILNAWAGFPMSSQRS